MHCCVVGQKWLEWFGLCGNNLLGAAGSLVCWMSSRTVLDVFYVKVL